MSKGRYGIHGGQYIPETLMHEIENLEKAYEHYKNDPDFCTELDTLNREYAGRPSLLYYAEKMTKDLGGAKIYDGEKAVKDTAYEVRWARNQGIFVIGIFVGNEEELSVEKRIYGKDFAYIRNISNFSRMVGTFLRRQIDIE